MMKVERTSPLVLSIVVMLAGCQTTIEYQYPIGIVPKAKQQLEVSVYDCVDLTHGQHKLHWANSTITNLPTVFADIMADVLSASGHFSNVERVATDFQSAKKERHPRRIGVVGEIQEYKSGSYPHPTVFINPICAPALVGIPTAYCLEEGWARLCVKLIDTGSQEVIDEMFIRSSFGPRDCWSSLWSEYRDRKREGRTLLETFAEEFRVEMAQRLNAGLAQQLAAISGGYETIQVAETHRPTKETLPYQPSPDVVSATSPGARWAVIIGISDYQDSRIPALRYASADARAFYDWAISPGAGNYAPSRVKLLLDEDATGANIKDALFDWAGSALVEDVVTVYFAGHGSPQSPDQPDNLFLLPYDVDYDRVSSTGFPMWDIETALKRFIKARKVIVIADACHAGGVGEAFDLARRADRGIIVNPISSGLQSLSKVGDGVCVISASDEKQLSQEGIDWGGGHGVFTYFLLKGLIREADYNKDGRVTLGELIPYLSEQVRRATRSAQSPTVAGKFDPALTIAK